MKFTNSNNNIKQVQIPIQIHNTMALQFIIITNQGLKYLRKLGTAKSNGYSEEEVKFLREVSDQKIHKDWEIKIPNRQFIMDKLKEKRDIVIFKDE